MNVYDLSGTKIVVADSNRYMRQLLCAILDGLGAPRPFLAPSGEMALRIIEEVQPDVLFADWDTSPVSGLELVRQLRDEEQSPSPTLPIIMMSNSASVDRVTESRDTGANEFLGKPISVEAVYRRIVALIERPRPFVRMDNYFGPDRRRRIEDFGGDERRRVDAIIAGPLEAAE